MFLILSAKIYFQNIFCVAQKNKIHTRLERHESEVNYDNFHFWVNYPFKNELSNREVSMPEATGVEPQSQQRQYEEEEMDHLYINEWKKITKQWMQKLQLFR